MTHRACALEGRAKDKFKRPKWPLAGRLMFFRTQNIGQTMHLTMLIGQQYLIATLKVRENNILVVDVSC